MTRLLLGSRHLGRTAAAGLSVDAGLLGLEQRRLPVARRLLGPASRLLRRRQLRLRLLRPRLRRRLLGPRRIPLQPRVQQHPGNIHITNVYNRTRRQQHHGQSRQLQRRQRWRSGPADRAGAGGGARAASAAGGGSDAAGAGRSRAIRQLRASANHGHPAIAATARPGEFTRRMGLSARASRQDPRRTHMSTVRAPTPPQPLDAQWRRTCGGTRPREHAPRSAHRATRSSARRCSARPSASSAPPGRRRHAAASCAAAASETCSETALRGEQAARTQRP